MYGHRYAIKTCSSTCRCSQLPMTRRDLKKKRSGDCCDVVGCDTSACCTHKISFFRDSISLVLDPLVQSCAHRSCQCRTSPPINAVLVTNRFDVALCRLVSTNHCQRRCCHEQYTQASNWGQSPSATFPTNKRRRRLENDHNDREEI